jgi:CPA2 family monovalent cation:H+ antiporter-2
MHDLPLLTTIAAGFAAAWALGLLTQWLKLSPIVGYLIAGVVIGPYTPGFVGDADAAVQMAEIGVILLMFGVGLHFQFQDLLRVRAIAVPGAVVQSAVAILAALLIFHFLGWSLRSGVVMGMAMAVASTVVLMRVLLDNKMLDTPHGHAAVGWLIVEDIFTILMLVVIPMIAFGAATPDGAVPGSDHAAPLDAAPPGNVLIAIAWALAKLVALVAVVLLAGSRVVPTILTQVARLRSRELFTLTVLVLSVTVAVGGAALFDTSVALGAFLAGMVVAQSSVSHEAAAEALPMRDAFGVLFFVSVGMLFDPAFVLERPLMVAAALAIVLIVKPLTALVIVAVLGYTTRTALTVAIGLAQIGEFSFILTQAARRHELIPPEGHHAVVAAAIISITLNPILFRSLPAIERFVEQRPRLWRIFNARADRKMRRINAEAAERITRDDGKPLAVIVGHGPVGRVVDALLSDSGMTTVIVEMNMDTVQSLTRAGHAAIYGDATRPAILKQAGVARAVHLIVTLPHFENRRPLILAARDLNPAIEVTVRARHLSEREDLKEAGASKIVYEEGEAGLALARHVMALRGIDEAKIEKMLDALRKLWLMQD